MRKLWTSVSVVALLCTLTARPSVAAADWFVAPVAPGGDGSRAKPFNDPWRALAVAASGDSIHIAEGVYFGRYDRSAWVVDRPKITILGGYDSAFSARDPWKHPSVLAFFGDYEGGNENNMLFGLGDHSGLVVDGLVIDGAGRNRYNPKPPFELRGGMKMVSTLASFGSADVTIRNCVFINSTTGGVELRGEGCRFENNLVMNHLGQPMLVLRELGRDDKRPMLIRGNTFAFAYDDSDPPMGRGGEKGVAIRVSAACQIEKNVFAGCGNTAINVFAKPDVVSIDQNVFWLSMRGNVAIRNEGREWLIKDKNLDEMGDLGIKSCKDNQVADVRLSGLNLEWVEGVSRNLLFSYATPPKEQLAALRSKYGLGEPPKPVNDDLGPVAPRLVVSDACALRVEGDAGARPIAQDVKLASATARPTLPSYTPTSWADLNAGAASLEGKAIEVVAAIGSERNGFVKSGITAEQYIGFDVYYPGGERLPDRIHVYAVRNASAHRQWQETSKSNNARDAEDFYLLRGICRLTGARQKATIEVQSVVPASAPPKPASPRPSGKQWFVRAGASGGDGSREKPFRDPFQALEKAAAGDILRVAGGDYFGKLRCGNWKIAAKHLTMLGGYDADFKARDPWKNPTRLVMSPDAEKKDKSEHSGKFLESSENSQGLILDGFVFDGSSLNSYFDAAAGGGLDLSGSLFGSLVQLQGSDITIRNCVFVNANGIAVELGSASGTFENNVVVNTSGTALRITAMGPGPWTIKRNTFLFATDPTGRAGTGQSAAGGLILLSGRASARIEGNILGFADNCAIRTTVPNDKLDVDGNSFGVNLSCHLTDSNRVWLYDRVWDRRLADAGFRSSRGNIQALPAGLPIDKQYADKVLVRLFELKGRYTREQWAQFASDAGASVTPPAPATTTEVVVEKPPEKPKEPTLEDLMAELDKLKQDTAKPVQSAPKGPPYCPAYPWRAAIELAGSKSGAVGAQRVTLTPD